MKNDVICKSANAHIYMRNFDGGLTFREMTEDDVPYVAGLMRSNYDDIVRGEFWEAGIPEMISDILRDRLANPEAFLGLVLDDLAYPFVLEHNGEIVGTMTMVDPHSEHYGFRGYDERYFDYPELIKLAVSAPGNGYGGLLMRCTEDFAYDVGYPGLIGGSSPTAKDFYYSLGYERVEDYKNKIGPGLVISGPILVKVFE